VDTNPKSPVIGDRSYGNTPGKVIEHGLAFGKGLISGGIVPCAKHFPGHGDAAIDSHLSLPLVTHDAKRLEQIEMEPFKAWARADLGPIMTAHVVYPSLDPENPATFSHSIVTGQLRDKLGFKGAVFSDDLEMGAVSEIGGPVEAAVTCINAGVDGLLICRDEDLQQAAWEKLIHEAEQDPGFDLKLETALSRIESIPKYPRSNSGFKWIGSDQHQKMKSSVVARLQGEIL